jgi:hypothetical protein
MTLEDLKKEMQAYINTPCYFGAHEAKRDLTQHWLRKLEAIDLPDPDEKLRKVREEIVNGDIGEIVQIMQDSFHTGYRHCKSSCLEIIDSHLTPSKPVDQELLDAQKRFPVGSWFRDINRGETIFKVNDIKRVDREYKPNVLVLTDCNGNWHCVDLCTPFALPKQRGE